MMSNSHEVNAVVGAVIDVTAAVALALANKACLTTYSHINGGADGQEEPETSKQKAFTTSGQT